MATLETRRATAEDAPVMAKLALELGYDCDVPAMRHRLASVSDAEDHAVFVAALDGHTVVGWVHVTHRRTMTSRAFVEITGLVVSSGYRRLGIGRALMQRSE
ncbi:MAG: GNAT family N-acetyltransferase, partial [Myxococcota bacterium]